MYRARVVKVKQSRESRFGAGRYHQLWITIIINNNPDDDDDDVCSSDNAGKNTTAVLVIRMLVIYL